MKVVCVRMSEAKWEALNRLAKLHNTTRSEIMRMLVDVLLANEEGISVEEKVKILLDELEQKPNLEDMRVRLKFRNVRVKRVRVA